MINVLLITVTLRQSFIESNTNISPDNKPFLPQITFRKHFVRKYNLNNNNCETC